MTSYGRDLLSQHLITPLIPNPNFHNQLLAAYEIMASADSTELLSTYIDALHILHHHGVLDAFGHLSVRNPDDPETFFMMHQLAPAAVSRLENIGEYRISDAEPVDTSTPVAPLERYIHNEALKRYSEVNVVLHGHPEELVAYGVSSVKLRPVIHMAPFLGMPHSIVFTLADTCSFGTCAYYALTQATQFPYLTSPSITSQTIPEIHPCATNNWELPSQQSLRVPQPALPGTGFRTEPIPIIPTRPITSS